MAPSRERWTSNLIEVARAIGDTAHQHNRWLALDAYSWERPEELINMWDDSLIELFVDEYGATFSRAQMDATVEFRDELNRYCGATLDFPDPEQVLADPRWEAVRTRARCFVEVFEDHSSK